MGRFEDVTERAGIAAPERYSTGCAFADVGGNGHLDLLLVALGGPNALFANDGAGRFTERGTDAGLSSSAGSTTIAVADVDGDGDLDLYVVNYKAYTNLDRISPQERAFDQMVRQVGPRRFEVRERYRRDYNCWSRLIRAFRRVYPPNPKITPSFLVFWNEALKLDVPRRCPIEMYSVAKGPGLTRASQWS